MAVQQTIFDSAGIDNKSNEQFNSNGVDQLKQAIVQSISDNLSGTIAQAVGSAVGNALSGVGERVDTLTGDVDSIKDDIKDIKENGYLEPWQKKVIEQAPKSRAFNLLGITWVKGKGCAEECMYDYKRYYSRFVRRARDDAKAAGLEASQYAYTPKKNYGKLVEFYADWRPACGVDGFKRQIDMEIKAKQELGIS